MSDEKMDPEMLARFAANGPPTNLEVTHPGFARNALGDTDDKLINPVARAIARASIEAAEPQTGRLSDKGIDQLVEFFSLRCYPEARAAIEAIEALSPKGHSEASVDSLNGAINTELLNRQKAMHTALYDLAMRCGKLITATDGMEPIRAERQAALDALVAAESTLALTNSVSGVKL
jgi:hypothetical protein